MVDGQPLFLVIKLWLVLVLVIISAVSKSKLVTAHDEQAKRKLEAGLVSTTGFISIDCGATEVYQDDTTGLFYKTDTGYVDTGEVHEILPYAGYAEEVNETSPYLKMGHSDLLLDMMLVLKITLPGTQRMSMIASGILLILLVSEIGFRFPESKINTESMGDDYQVPDTVLRTAARTQNASIPLSLYWTLPDFASASPCHVYFHFAEIEKLKDGQKRELSIVLNSTGIGPLDTYPITLEYLTPTTKISSDLPFGGTKIQFSIYASNATDQGPDLAPILNAVEIFMFLRLPYSPTNLDDGKFSSFGRNLSSSELTGDIANSVSNLKSIMFLDLSYNNLTGRLPEFLAQVPSLKMLNLTGNKFTAGSVPDALLEKSKNRALLLRFLFFFN
ncbi:hypothetical protein EZV62_003720 [Acer yangbiense]|uniref:Malectin-like domain-containing protein n=1 Tax=Acer yangbiense TaxID=1000413 RepID=A0A5C7II80_9ROSI|nr:hypothetical protein EZV62_003720 [Acer yangbiense]